VKHYEDKRNTVYQTYDDSHFPKEASPFRKSSPNGHGGGPRGKTNKTKVTNKRKVDQLFRLRASMVRPTTYVAGILRRRILKKSVAGLQVLFLSHFSFNLGKITYMSRGSCILYVYRKKTPYFSCLNLVLELINVVLLAPVLTAELTENA